MKIIQTLFLIISVLLLASCSNGRYQDKHDSIPTRLPNQNEQQDAIARAEPYSRGGNKNYQVRGINYKVLPSAENFEQIGTASWYGNKFHGHLTSNGEIYDMYAMSAAHKHLPLPTYLRVTNLANNKSVIVRVNDRGPFHQNRIIDLSYSAAYKLDMLKSGTAEVKISSITDFGEKVTTMSSPITKQEIETKPIVSKTIADHLLEQSLTKEKDHIQVFATSKHELAQTIAREISAKYSQTVKFPKENGIYRIQIGPIANTTTLNNLLIELKKGSYPNAYLKAL